MIFFFSILKPLLFQFFRKKRFKINLDIINVRKCSLFHSLADDELRIFIFTSNLEPFKMASRSILPSSDMSNF